MSSEYVMLSTRIKHLNPTLCYGEEMKMFSYREEEREIEALTLLSQKDGSDWNDDRCHRLKYGDRISKGTEGTEDTNPNDP